LGRLLTKLESAPPAANQAEVIRFKNPPNDVAYGDGSTIASRTKSVLKPARPDLTNAWYRSRDLMYLRRNSVAKPIRMPIQIAVR
jgi:hypothetical protein